MKITINLTLDGDVLKFKNEKGEWQPVTPTAPSTGVDCGDEVDWVGDETISKIKIKPNKSKILDKVDGDDTRKPKGMVRKSIEGKISEKYTISVKGERGGGYTDFDPDLHYPPKTD